MVASHISPLAASNVSDPVVILAIALGMAGVAILILFYKQKI
jgi:hypothetical protein